MAGRYEKEQKELWLKSLVLICDELIIKVEEVRDLCIEGLNKPHKADRDSIDNTITRINNYSYKLHELNKLLKE